MEKHECGTKLSIVYTTASSKWKQLQTVKKSEKDFRDIVTQYYWCKKCEIFVKVVKKVYDVK